MCNAKIEATRDTDSSTNRRAHSATTRSSSAVFTHRITNVPPTLLSWWRQTCWTLTDLSMSVLTCGRWCAVYLTMRLQPAPTLHIDSFPTNTTTNRPSRLHLWQHLQLCLTSWYNLHRTDNAMSSIQPSQPSEAEPKLELPSLESTPNSSSDELESKEPDKFQPGWRFLAAFGSLCIITLMAALDATSLSVALPVCRSPQSSVRQRLMFDRLWLKLSEALP